MRKNMRVNKVVTSFLLMVFIITTTNSLVYSKPVKGAGDNTEYVNELEGTNKGKRIFKESLIQLEEEGIFTKEEVNKIKEYNKELRGLPRGEKENKENAKIKRDRIEMMIKDKIISKEQGAALKKRIFYLNKK